MEQIYEPTEEHRTKLGKAHGELLVGEELIDHLEGTERSVVCVGDRVSRDLAGSGVEADTFVVDGKIQRKEVETPDIAVEREFVARNPAGGITRQAWDAIRKALAVDCTSMLRIDGEEDLLALPAVTMLPDDAVVVYGLRNQGAVAMEVSETREFAEELLDLDRCGKLIVGGSWRFLHAGHRYMLLKAFELGENVDIGVTSERMLRKKLKRESEESFEERKEQVEQFLERHGFEDRARIMEIDDIYGNAVEEGDRLLVTPETEPGADRINERRKEKGREEIDVEVLEKLEAEDGGPVSSTRIADGTIDGNGLQKKLLQV
ncbi:MAG: pantetheine-phosphate adenylyltransferase [Candidatus Nanohaloarchaea archaeon]